MRFHWVPGELVGRGRLLGGLYSEDEPLSGDRVYCQDIGECLQVSVRAGRDTYLGSHGLEGCHVFHLPSIWEGGYWICDFPFRREFR
jgi:hypothetical protein